jgi:signal peptidase I
MSVFATRPEETHAIKCDLAAEVLRSAGSLRLQVMGLSMLPSIWPGDMLVIERVSADAVAEGEIVLFGRNQRLFVHRVVKAAEDGSTFLTRGDAMPQPDPPVPSGALLGKVSFVVRNGRLMQPSRSLDFPKKAIAALMRNSEVAARVAVGINGRLQAGGRQSSCDRTVPCQS